MKTAKDDSYKIRCTRCGAKNRIPEDKLGKNARCGKCRQALQTEALFLPQPVMISDLDFDAKVLQSPIPVLAYFWAPWCPTCSSVSPTIDEFAAASKGRIRVVKINVDADPKTASRYNILSVPSLLAFDNGRIQETLSGSMQKHDLMVAMAKYL